MPYGAFFEHTVLQRTPAGARVVVKANKARAPMLVVNPGVMVSLSLQSASAAAKHRCSSDCQCRLAVDSTHANSAHS